MALGNVRFGSTAGMTINLPNVRFGLKSGRGSKWSWGSTVAGRECESF
jgi:hypothetical protein